MTREEQEAAAADGMELIKDAREIKALAKHNTPLSAFHDTKKTLESIENKVSLCLTSYPQAVTFISAACAPCSYWDTDCDSFCP